MLPGDSIASAVGRVQGELRGHRNEDRFGPQRCVWGSDFPCELWCPKITYAQHLQIFTEELGLDASTKQVILGETAHRLWFQKP